MKEVITHDLGEFITQIGLEAERISRLPCEKSVEIKGRVELSENHRGSGENYYLFGASFNNPSTKFNYATCGQYDKETRQEILEENLNLIREKLKQEEGRYFTMVSRSNLSVSCVGPRHFLPPER